MNPASDNPAEKQVFSMSFEQAKLEALRAEIAIGLNEAARNQFVVFNAASVKKDGRARRMLS